MTLSIESNNSIDSHAAVDDVPHEEPEVSFERTLPRHLVHRAANAEVLLTSFRQRGESSFVVGAQLPRTHGLYRPIGGTYDSMLFAEAVRQSGLVLGHAGFGVPRGYQYVMWTLSYEMVPLGLRLAETPANLTLEIECSDVKWRGKNFSGARMRVLAYRERNFVGRADVEFSCLSPAVFARLRTNGADWDFALEEELPEPVRPETAGRARSFDVVLSPTEHENSWQLRVERDHPVLFDHPVEHVPGMAILEGFRQAAQCRFYPDAVMPVGMDARFHRYVELGRPCRIRVVEPDAGGEERISMVAEQSGETMVEAALDVRVFE
ncbi:ScbA/BarX family gamma-butyrolactone biosynthesis protein [Actinopolyspora halophila]|uniref:ScbA/BarX family gamma-butyrolactone biosynthesis protein n=1 Tax=Actinopolyspora halophila TaxID=1850 RepID=UPI00037C895E|nr:ScbA/BarX family gamma-butyrolactone biosynthesis protein [Actinopolyspora halophila]